MWSVTCKIWIDDIMDAREGEGEGVVIVFSSITKAGAVCDSSLVAPAILPNIQNTTEHIN